MTTVASLLIYGMLLLVFFYASARVITRAVLRTVDEHQLKKDRR